MDTNGAAEPLSLVSDSAIISLIRQLLVSEETKFSQHDPSLHNSEPAVDNARQEAGCLLWDMAAIEEHATVMAVSPGPWCALLAILQLTT